MTVLKTEAPPAWIDGPVDVEDPADRLRPAQEKRLLRMTELLRTDLAVLAQVAHIKAAMAEGEDMEACGLWHELEEHEQEALWIAPSYGGIFTTAERKTLKEGPE